MLYRNCLTHANGVVTARYCNNAAKDKLVITGQRFNLFFQKGGLQVPAEMNKPGPENSPLMLGAEEFHLEFNLNRSIELSVKQFLDILNTCVFVRADVEEKLAKSTISS
jgi:hypothetical protein